MLGDGFLSENARGGETPPWVRVGDNGDGKTSPGSWNWEDEKA